MELIVTLNNLREAAAQFWKLNEGKKIFAFSGSLGAGKTTFITALCQYKHVNGSVSSPTFSIINEYSYSEGIIYHVDLYRLHDEQEAIRTGIEDVLDSGMICLVEWPERAPGIFPDDTVWIQIENIDSSTRKLLLTTERPSVHS
jgi:tRNA threonylcarbamoyladenosine biosynthesis protein TsaE